MCRCENWAIKAEHQRIDAFELWCWRRLLRVPWTTRRSNQSILKKINPECSVEGLMLKLQYLDQVMRRANSLEKMLMLGKIEGKRRRGRQKMRWLDGIIDDGREFEQTPGKSGGQRRVAVHGVAKSQTRLSDRTTTMNVLRSKDQGPPGGASQGPEKAVPASAGAVAPGPGSTASWWPRAAPFQTQGPPQAVTGGPLPQPPAFSYAFPHSQPCPLFHQIYGQRGGATI